MSDIKYPNFTDLAGSTGGTILNGSTSTRNLLMYCSNDLLMEVLDLIDRGYEVLVSNGKIKAVDVI